MRNVIVLVGLLVFSGDIFANKFVSNGVIPNQYIIVYKDQNNVSSAFMSATGESVRQVSERLVTEAEQHQLLQDNQQGVSSQNRKIFNKLEFVYEYALKGFSATLTESGLNYLQQNQLIDYIEPDGVMQTNILQQPAVSWGLDRVDQRDLPLDNTYEYVVDGSNVHAYIIDAGIRETHNEFFGRVGVGIDVVDNDDIPEDCNGHGTHVAGTVGGLEYGVAKNVTLHAVRVLNCDGDGETSQVIAGVDWVRNNVKFPAVANMSLGGSVQQSLDDAVNNAIAAGITFVVAAGNNDGSDACNQSPARVPNAITVASSTINDQRSNFSNIGTCVDLFAPGTDIISAWWFNDASTKTISGTSMSAPHVAGAAALFLEDNNASTPAQVAGAIINDSTLDQIGNAGIGTPNRLLFSQLDSNPVPVQNLSWLIPVVNLILF